jgi:hypothetical protein
MAALNPYLSANRLKGCMLLFVLLAFAGCLTHPPLEEPDTHISGVHIDTWHGISIFLEEELGLINQRWMPIRWIPIKDYLDRWWDSISPAQQNIWTTNVSELQITTGNNISLKPMLYFETRALIYIDYIGYIGVDYDLTKLGEYLSAALAVLALADEPQPQLGWSIQQSDTWHGKVVYLETGTAARQWTTIKGNLDIWWSTLSTAQQNTWTTKVSNLWITNGTNVRLSGVSTLYIGENDPVKLREYLSAVITLLALQDVEYPPTTDASPTRAAPEPPASIASAFSSVRYPPRYYGILEGTVIFIVQANNYIDQQFVTNQQVEIAVATIQHLLRGLSGSRQNAFKNNVTLIWVQPTGLAVNFTSDGFLVMPYDVNGTDLVTFLDANRLLN